MAERAKGFRRFSEELVVRRTGNTTAEWDRPDGPGRAPVWGRPSGRILDEWGAKEKGHSPACRQAGLTAKHLGSEYGLSGWWAQAVTIRYEYERGLRG